VDGGICDQWQWPASISDVGDRNSSVRIDVTNVGTTHRLRSVRAGQDDPVSDWQTPCVWVRPDLVVADTSQIGPLGVSLGRSEVSAAMRYNGISIQPHLYQRLCTGRDVTRRAGTSVGVPGYPESPPPLCSVHMSV
jgi:hypothetical protein